MNSFLGYRMLGVDNKPNVRQLPPPPHTGQAEARMSTFEPTISRGTKSLVRKRPELQAPFEQRRAIMDAKRQERERLRQAARVGGG